MANANAHFDPKVLSFLHDTSSVVPHRDSGNARALEKSGAIGKLHIAMYISLRTTSRNRAGNRQEEEPLVPRRVRRDPEK